MNESLRRAYNALACGDHEQAINHLYDAATFAQLDDNQAGVAACVKAIVAVNRSVGRRHLVLA